MRALKHLVYTDPQNQNADDFDVRPFVDSGTEI